MTLSAKAVKICSGEQPKYLQFGTLASPTTSATAVSNGLAAAKTSPYAVFQVLLAGTGAVNATVQIQATLEDATAYGVNANWVLIDTITITSAAAPQTGTGTNPVGSWRYVRAAVTAIAGTGATVQVLMGT